MKQVLAISILALAGCTDSSGAHKALEGAGYNDIQLHGYKFFGCGEHDVYHTAFDANGPTGKPVSGVVCAGLLKGSTIRTD